MKKTPIITALALAAFSSPLFAQAQTYTNFIRQTQYPTGLVWDMTVAAAGAQQSALPIDPGGARFELWTVSSVGPTSYLLASNYVGTYIPLATLEILSEDTTSAVKRTRADRPFSVKYSVSGLLSGDTDPEPSKKVDFLWHVQSYGEGGTGENLDRTQAILQSHTGIEKNGDGTLQFELTSVPGGDRSKVRGEERFSIYSLADYQAPAAQLAGETIQVWPVADGDIDGITSGQLVRYAVPQLTFTLRDLYPFSTTYAQAYQGNAQLGVEGKILPGSALVIDEAVPVSRTLVVDDYGDALGADGIWTIELLTKTPFGIDRLAYVTFNLDRTMKVNGNINTIK